MNRRSVVAVALLVVACARGSDRADTSATKSDTAGMVGMNVPGMMSAAAMDSMAGHMRMMDTANSASLQAMLPMHRQSVANMIARMDTEMRGMNMQADAGWSALMDSVRQDLLRMPELTGAQLKSFAAAHSRRVERLMQSHKDMKKKM